MTTVEESSNLFGWPDWFFRSGHTYPVIRVGWLPLPSGRHWVLENGNVYVSFAGFEELKKLGDATR